MTTSRAVTHLRHGGLLIYPTETAYALGCDATNAHAVASIFRLKEREHSKPLPLIVASRVMAERYARFTSLAKKLVRRHWPGPLTIVAASAKLQATSRLVSGILAPDDSIAFRISSHPIARALSRVLGRPIVSTSANRSGQPPCYTVRSALRSLGYGAGGKTSGVDRETPDVEESAPMLKSPQRRSNLENRSGMLVLDIGPLPRRRPSTIVDARGDALRTLRRGTIRV